MSDNNDQICVDVFSKQMFRWMNDYNFKKVTHPRYGDYYTITVDKREKNKVIRRCNRSHVKYRWYEKKWTRSGDYRKKFLQNTSPPYKCRYCGKKLTPENLVVDHVVPVAKVKKSQRARRMLRRRGIHDVNDIRNLVPSCKRCNAKKGDQLGIWYIRGIFGDSKHYRLIEKIAKIIVIIAVIFLVLHLLRASNFTYSIRVFK